MAKLASLIIVPGVCAPMSALALTFLNFVPDQESKVFCCQVSIFSFIFLRIVISGKFNTRPEMAYAFIRNGPFQTDGHFENPHSKVFLPLKVLKLNLKLFFFTRQKLPKMPQ